MNQSIEKINEIHKSVPPEFYEQGIKNNPIQRYWHFKRFKVIEEMVRDLSGNILDLGCHSGLLTDKISQFTRANQVYGLDISENAISYAQTKYPHIKFKVQDINFGIPYPEKMFDLVTCFDILEHVADPFVLINEIKRVLKKDGFVIVEIPNETLLFRFIWFVWTRLEGKVWKDVHINRFGIKDLKNLFEKNGFIKIDERKIHLNMLWIVKYKKK